MLFLLSPAKSLDETSPVPPELRKLTTRPAGTDRSAGLIDLLRQRSPAQLGALMGISPALAALNAARYADWRPSFGARDARPAALMFNGDVYHGLDAPSLSVDDLLWAQDHLGILSGLHGLLRPLDRIRPYRLEMGTKLANPRGADLYAFWADTLAARIDRAVAPHRAPVVVNLASVEYFDAVARSARPLRAPTIDCVFQERRPDGRPASRPDDDRDDDQDDDDAYRIVAFHAKRARGLMARHAILHRVETPDGLKTFATEGYRHVAAASSAERFVFRRPRPAAGPVTGDAAVAPATAAP